MRLLAPWLFVLPAFLLGASREEFGHPVALSSRLFRGQAQPRSREDIKITGTTFRRSRGQKLNHSVVGIIVGLVGQDQN